MRLGLIIALLITLSCNITWAAENINITTKTDNFFENLISDTLLLLNPDLKKIIDADFDHVVKSSKFELAVNSWKPRPNPKTRLAIISDRLNSNNINNSLSSLVQPVLEIACSSQKQDLLNEYQSKCIKNMFKYPIIQPIEIKYTYESGKTKEQYIADLSGLNDSNRYQQMVRTTADIMNTAYEKISKKNVVKSVHVVKYPLPMFAGSPSGSGKTSYSSAGSECIKPHSTSKTSGYDYDLIAYKHCLDMELQKAGGTVNRTKSTPSASGGTYAQPKDTGPCMGACGSEMGICQGQCMGNGSCTARCAEAQGRCISRCN